MRHQRVIPRGGVRLLLGSINLHDAYSYFHHSFHSSSVDEAETFSNSPHMETSSAAAEPFFRCCDASTISFDGLSDTEKNYYSEVGVLCDGEYVITEGFLNLLKTLNDGKKVVVIQGLKALAKVSH